MTSSWNGKRHAAVDATVALSELLIDDAADTRRLFVGYLDAKRSLATAFQALAEDLWLDPGPLEQVKMLVENAMHELYPDLPAKYRLVRGFGRVHQLLFAYLSQRIGQEVASDELRILTADAVHTERRARDLRELGLQLDTYENGGITVYVLRDEVPASARAARAIATKNVLDDKALGSAQRASLLSMIP